MTTISGTSLELHHLTYGSFTLANLRSLKGLSWCRDTVRDQDQDREVTMDLKNGLKTYPPTSIVTFLIPKEDSDLKTPTISSVGCDRCAFTLPDTETDTDRESYRYR